MIETQVIILFYSLTVFYIALDLFLLRKLLYLGDLEIQQTCCQQGIEDEMKNRIKELETKLERGKNAIKD